MGIDPITFIAQIINLIVLVFLLQKFLYQPVVKIIQKRRDEINEMVQRTEDLQNQVDNERKALEKAHMEYEADKKSRENKLQHDLTTQRLENKKILQQEIETAKKNMQTELIEQSAILKLEFENFISQEFIKTAGRIITDLTGATPIERVLNLFYQKFDNLPKKEKSKIEKEIINQKDIYIYSSDTLMPFHKKDMEDFLKNRLPINPKCKLHFQVKPELVLGIALKFQNTQIDWSIQNYLDNLNEQLTTTINHLSQES